MSDGGRIFGSAGWAWGGKVRVRTTQARAGMVQPAQPIPYPQVQAMGDDSAGFGSVAFVQKFGSSMNLNPHCTCLCSTGSTSVGQSFGPRTDPAVIRLKRVVDRAGERTPDHLPVHPECTARRHPRAFIFYTSSSVSTESTRAAPGAPVAPAPRRHDSPRGGSSRSSPRLLPTNAQSLLRSLTSAAFITLSSFSVLLEGL